MAYSYFPTGYQPAYQPYQGGTSSIVWVSGEAGAKAYMVAPNTTVALWDSEAQVIYLKSADASGMPSIKTLDYTIREIPRQTRTDAPEPRYATKDDITAIKAEIERIKEDLGYGQSLVSNDESRKQPVGTV